MEKTLKEKIIKEYFIVKVDITVPATITYRVYAEGPEQAIELAKKGNEVVVERKVGWPKAKKLKAVAYTAGTSIIRFIKNNL